MGNFRKTIAFLLVFLPYCLTVIFNGSIESATINPLPNDRSSRTESCFLLSAADSFGPGERNENNIKEISRLPSTSPNNHVNSLVARLITEESFFIIKFSRCLFYSSNIDDHFNQTDIIFPFHYFW